MKMVFHAALRVVSVIALFAVAVEAQTVNISGTRLTYPLVRKWISEFSKDYPQIKVQITHGAPADSIDISILAFQFDRESVLKTNKEAVVIAQYVQLPIANSKRPDLKQLQGKGFTESDFKKIYFEAKTPTEPQGKAPIVVYKREKPACAAKSFAQHYGSNANNAPGIGVSGDDSDLSKAVKNDVNGLSYNNLGFIYNIQRRLVNDSLAVVPLDLNENGKIDAYEKIYTTLDDVVNFVEKTRHPKIPTDGVNAIFRKDNPNKNAGIFLQWVLSKGAAFNHEWGFVNPEKENLAKQQQILKSNFSN